jgi:hypothetical protein
LFIQFREEFGVMPMKEGKKSKGNRRRSEKVRRKSNATPDSAVIGVSIFMGKQKRHNPNDLLAYHDGYH